MYSKYDGHKEDAAIKKAQSIAFSNKGLNTTTVKRIKTHYLYGNNNYPEDVIDLLKKVLPAYGMNNNDVIDYINKHILVLFVHPTILETKLAILHLINADEAVLLGNQSLLLKGKTKDLYAGVKVAQVLIDEKGIDWDVNVFTKFIEESSEHLVNGYGKRFPFDQEALSGTVRAYRKFIKNNTPGSITPDSKNNKSFDESDIIKLEKSL